MKTKHDKTEKQFIIEVWPLSCAEDRAEVHYSVSWKGAQAKKRLLVKKYNGLNKPVNVKISDCCLD